MNWYIEVLRKYATFEGRARRTEYWMFVLFNMLITMALVFFEGMVGVATESDTSVLGSIYSLGVLLPSLAVGVRRLHDTDKSGWFMLLAFIPLVNFVLLFFFIQEGDRGFNQYGPDPKATTVAIGAAPSVPSGWHPDPTGRHQFRYWDAGQWTHHVSDNGVVSTDPVQ